MSNEHAMSASDLTAIAAHLHVQLRRRTGRVTDVEWMVSNREYANTIISLAKASALTEGAPELEKWARRFEFALSHVQRPRQPLMSALAISSAALHERQRSPVSSPAPISQFASSTQFDDSVVTEFGDSHRVVDTSRVPLPRRERYVWGLR